MLGGIFRYSEKKLARDVARIAAVIDSSFCAEYQPKQSSVKISHAQRTAESPAVIYLGNLLLKVRDLPRGERETVLAKTVREMLSKEQLPPDDLMASLALRARTRQEMHLRRRILELNGNNFPDTVTFGDGELFLELMVDNATTVSTISRERLSAASTTTEDAYRIAVATLARATTGAQWTVLAEHIWASSYQDDYDFTRLVVAGADARLPFTSAPRVFAPSHAVCLVTDSDEDSVLREMIELGYKRSENHRPFSNLFWTRNGGAWIRWAPSVGEKGYKASELQRMKETLSQYTEQKLYLEQLLEARNEDVFVASYQPFETKEGCSSRCAYTLSLATYLPKTDDVMLVAVNRDEKPSVLGRIAWTEFEAALGPEMLTPMPDELPLRFCLTAALSAEQEEALRAAVRAPE